MKRSRLAWLIFQETWPLGKSIFSPPFTASSKKKFSSLLKLILCMTFAQVCKVTKWVDHEVVWAVETHLAEEKGRGIIEVATPFATSQRALTPYFSANRKSDITATLHWEQTLVKAFWIISLSCNLSSIPMSGIFSRRKIHWSTFLISVSYTSSYTLLHGCSKPWVPGSQYPCLTTTCGQITLVAVTISRATLVVLSFLLIHPLSKSYWCDKHRIYKYASVQHENMNFSSVQS